jgi:hypothetical protein
MDMDNEEFDWHMYASNLTEPESGKGATTGMRPTKAYFQRVIVPRKDGAQLVGIVWDNTWGAKDIMTELGARLVRKENVEAVMAKSGEVELSLNVDAPYAQPDYPDAHSVRMFLCTDFPERDLASVHEAIVNYFQKNLNLNGPKTKLGVHIPVKWEVVERENYLLDSLNKLKAWGCVVAASGRIVLPSAKGYKG